MIVVGLSNNRWTFSYRSKGGKGLSRKTFAATDIGVGHMKEWLHKNWITRHHVICSSSIDFPNDGNRLPPDYPAHEILGRCLYGSDVPNLPDAARAAFDAFVVYGRARAKGKSLPEFKALRKAMMILERSMSMELAS